MKGQTHNKYYLNLPLIVLVTNSYILNAYEEVSLNEGIVPRFTLTQWMNNILAFKLPNTFFVNTNLQPKLFPFFLKLSQFIDRNKD